MSNEININGKCTVVYLLEKGHVCIGVIFLPMVIIMYLIWVHFILLSQVLVVHTAERYYTLNNTVVLLTLALGIFTPDNQEFPASKMWISNFFVKVKRILCWKNQKLNNFDNWHLFFACLWRQIYIPGILDMVFWKVIWKSMNTMFSIPL